MQRYILNYVLEVDIFPNMVDICIFKCKTALFYFNVLFLPLEIYTI